MQKKIGIIGAGNVGGELARIIANRGFADITLLDLPSRADLARGKALDIAQAASLCGVDAMVRGTSSWVDVADSDVLVITVGLPRKPGQSREDLVYANLPAIYDVARQVRRYCPGAFSIVLSNPLDVMVYEYRRVAEAPAKRVVGMAGILDSARLAFFIARELGTSVRDIHAITLGNHGDSMVPVMSSATCAGIPIDSLLSHGALDRIIDRTRNNGSEFVALMGTSAYYAAAESTLAIIESYLFNLKRILPCAVFLRGEYGQEDIYMGVPAVIGELGVENIITTKLSNDEKRQLDGSASKIRALLDIVRQCAPSSSDDEPVTAAAAATGSPGLAPL